MLIGYTITIYQSFINDYTYTANCLFDSQSPTRRRPVADQSPTSCRPVATHFQSVGNQSPTNRRPVADWSPSFRDSCRRPVADWSATEKCSFWSHSGCIDCSCFLVARQSPTGCSTCVTGALSDVIINWPMATRTAQIMALIILQQWGSKFEYFGKIIHYGSVGDREIYTPLGLISLFTFLFIFEALSSSWLTMYIEGNNYVIGFIEDPFCNYKGCSLIEVLFVFKSTSILTRVEIW